MIEEISANLYKIEIPLAGSPLRALNSYLIRSSHSNLIIDTGWDREECMEAMQASLRKLGVDIRETHFFITHLHADHLGLVSKLATDASTIYFNQPEADWIQSGSRWDSLFEFARKSGFPENELQAVLRDHPGYNYGLRGHLAFTILKDNDTISVGDYVFRCIETPGHSSGHMCLYEPDKKIFVAGDHILSDITPNIQAWSDDRNRLKEYLASLDKVYDLDIEVVLPGHRRVFRNCKKRIEELKRHHNKRADEVLSILEKGGTNAYQVASQMSWDIICESWDLFPVSQKWFATGEAIAHLQYLEERGMIRREMRGGNIVFSLNQSHGCVENNT